MVTSIYWNRSEGNPLSTVIGYRFNLTITEAILDCIFGRNQQVNYLQKKCMNCMQGGLGGIRNLVVSGFDYHLKGYDKADPAISQAISRPGLCYS